MAVEKDHTPTKKEGYPPPPAPAPGPTPGLCQTGCRVKFLPYPKWNIWADYKHRRRPSSQDILDF